MKPLVCIIIVNWNGKDVVKENLDSLLAKTKYKNYKIIVVDNGSTDGAREMLEGYKKIDLVKLKENLGYASGLNKGYKYALEKYNPDYLCNISNDVVTIQPDWLDKMVETLEEKEENGICGNKLVFPDNRLQLLWWGRDPKNFREKDEGQYDFVKEARAVGGAVMLIKTSVVKKIGGTDENYFYGPDDLDFCCRAGKAGFKIFYNGFSKSIHVGSFSYLSAGRDFIFKHQVYGYVLFYLRWCKPSEKMKIFINQLARAFLTRKDPFNKKSMENTFFHRAFPKRILYWAISSTKGLSNFRTIDHRNYDSTVRKL